MTGAIIFSNEELRAEQRAMIRACEQAGLMRKNLAADFDCHTSNFNLVASDASNYVLPARFDRGLLSQCAQIGQFQFIERLLPPGYYIAYAPEGMANGSYVDELLEGQEALGDTSRAIKHRDHMDTRTKGQKLIEIGSRLVAEAAQKIRVSHGANMFG